MRLALLISLVLSVSTAALALDPVSFIVSKNPELREIRRFNQGLLSHLRVTLKAQGKQGHEVVSELYAEERARFGYDLRIIAELPLFAPAEHLKMRLKELELERSLRREAAKAVSRYRSLRKALVREKALITATREECLWLKRRVEAGLEPSDRVIACVKDLEERKKHLEAMEEELFEAREAVLSLVSPADRKTLESALEKDL